MVQETAAFQGVVSSPAQEIENIRTGNVKAERGFLNKKKKKPMGYAEQQFRKKASIAEQQRREAVGEEAQTSRIAKDFARKDFGQQRQQEFSKVKHISRIQLTRPTGLNPRRVVRGNPRSKGVIYRDKSKPERIKQLEKGGMVHIDTSKKWTTSGWQETEKPLSRSYFIGRSIIQKQPWEGISSPQIVGRGSAGKNRSAGGTIELPRAELRRKREEKRKKEIKKMHEERLREKIKKNKLMGENAFNALLKEQERRQQMIFGFEG